MSKQEWHGLAKGHWVAIIVACITSSGVVIAALISQGGNASYQSQIDDLRAKLAEAEKSKHPNIAAVPEIVNRDLDEARSLLKQLGFNPVIHELVTLSESATKQVVKQYPSGGAIVDWGLDVILDYSAPENSLTINHASERFGTDNTPSALLLTGDVRLDPTAQIPYKPTIIVLLKKNGQYEVIDSLNATSSGIWQSVIPKNEMLDTNTLDVTAILTTQKLPKGEKLSLEQPKVPIIDKSTIVFEKEQRASVINLKLESDKHAYRIGDKIAVTGNVTSIVPNTNVLIKVVSPTGSSTVFYTNIMPDGTYRYEFGLSENASLGIYIVVVYYNGYKASTNFQLISS